MGLTQSSKTKGNTNQTSTRAHRRPSAEERQKLCRQTSPGCPGAAHAEIHTENHYTITTSIGRRSSFEDISPETFVRSFQITPCLIRIIARSKRFVDQQTLKRRRGKQNEPVQPRKLQIPNTTVPSALWRCLRPSINLHKPW